MKRNYGYRRRQGRQKHHIKQKIPKLAGYTILVAVMATSALIPYVFRPQYASALGIANSSAPKGLPEESFGSLSNEPLFKAIIRNGGSIILVNEIIDKDISIHNTAGLWDPNIGAIKLKRGNYSYDAYLNIMKHEAIHMAQSCGNFSLNAEALPLGLKVTAEGMRNLEPYKETNPEYFNSQVEREAYSNDNMNQEYIAGIVDRYCGSNPWDTLMGKLRHPLQIWYYKKMK